MAMRWPWMRELAAGGALILVLGVSSWNQTAARDPGPAPPVRADASPRGEGAFPDEATAAPEGAKTSVGWAVGLDHGGYATILHTTDGGQTWVRQGSPGGLADGDLTGAAAASAQEAWVAGNKAQDGLLLHTLDGGQTWNAEGDVEDLSGNGLIAVSAADARTAWAVGDNGLILHTTDGGDHWVRQGEGQVPAVAFNGVYAADTQHAWAVGPEEAGNNYGTIVRTTDGGQTWSKVPYTITHTTHPSGVYLITVHGVGPDEIWAVGRDQIIHVSVTASGILATDQTPDTGAYDINGVFAVNRKKIWAGADGGVVWRSVDGGKKWANRSPQGAGYAFRVWALDKQHAWVTTGDYSGQGQVLYTADGGKHWTSQSIPANPQMWGISFVK